MRIRVTGILVAALAAGLLLLPAASAQEQPQTEHYTAVWMVVGGSGGGSTMSIDIRINKYNTEEEIKKYADLLVEGGPTDSEGAGKEDVGQVSPVGRVGTPSRLPANLSTATRRSSAW